MCRSQTLGQSIKRSTVGIRELIFRFTAGSTAFIFDNVGIVFDLFYINSASTCSVGKCRVAPHIASLAFRKRVKCGKKSFKLRTVRIGTDSLDSIFKRGKPCPHRPAVLGSEVVKRPKPLSLSVKRCHSTKSLPARNTV